MKNKQFLLFTFFNEQEVNYKQKIKKLILGLLFLVSFYSNAQASISYSDISEAKEKPSYDGDIVEYKAKDGSVYKVGDQITIGVPSSNKTFAFLTTGDGLMTPLVPLGINASGQKTEIIKFRISGTRRSGFTIWLKTKSPYGIGNYNVDFENAINNGEIKSYGMTSNEALEELKRAKDKLELGLISKEEFESKKSELSKFIK